MSRKTKSRLKRERGHRPLQRFTGPLLILVAAAVGVWPLVKMGPSCGPDFHFHFVSWIEAQRSILDGVLYPHWASGPNFGAGEPRFVFYPPLMWMTGGFLGLVVPWGAVSIVLLYLLFAATGLANRALARQMLGNGPATLAGCASIFIGNILVDGYLRGDYGELAGGFWIPLLLMFQLRRSVPSGAFLPRWLAGVVPLSLVVAGIWLTNGPLGIMASYLLLATAVVSAAISKSWAPLARAAFSALLGGALAAFYLLPAIWERGWANFGAAVSEWAYVIENGWLFSQPADSSWIHQDTSSDIHSWVAVAMFGISAIAVGIAWKRGKLTAERAWWIPLALIPVAVLLMQVPVSEPLWNRLPALRYLQFPWRWLVVMNGSLSVFFAAAVWVNPLRGRIAITTACALLFFVITGCTLGVCFQNCHNVVSTIPQLEQTEGIRGKPEYAPPGIRHALLERDVAGNCEVSNLSDLAGEPVRELSAAQDGKPACDGEFVQTENRPEDKTFMGSGDRAGYLILHLRSYPAWRVTVNGQAAAAAREEGYGLMAVPIPQGKVVVAVEWETTPDVWVGRSISVLAFALLTALYVVERKAARQSRV
ncbi:MAG: hypothetical protein WCA11_14130 [Terracidiphilus sp.]